MDLEAHRGRLAMEVTVMRRLWMWGGSSQWGGLVSSVPSSVPVQGAPPCLEAGCGSSELSLLRCVESLCPGSVLDAIPLPLTPQYPFEALFRSQHYALLDNSCREYLFICEFFVVSGPAAHDLFHAVMGRTLTMTLVSLRSLRFPSSQTLNSQ